MGRNSSGVNNYSKATSTMSIAVNSNGKRLTSSQVNTMLATSTSIGDMRNRDMAKQLGRAISRYEKVMGLRERTIKLADIDGSYGVTFISADGSKGVYLNKKFFDRKKKQVEADYKRTEYKGGHKNVTNRASQHTMTHELAHATWTSSYTSAKHKAAGKEIRSLYQQWSKDKNRKGYGSYGRSNVDEFWAEVVTKGIHGKADKYTRKAISIAHKYKL